MRKSVITLSRQFGSGGSEIGKELAKMLGIRYVDKAIIAEAAESSGISKELFEKADEKRTSSFLYSLATSSYAGYVSPMQLDDIISEDKLFLYTSQAIKKFAAEEPCLIVGRCADDILDKNKIVRVYIYADMDDRIKRIARLYDINEKAAATLIKKADKKRAGYYNFYTGKTWGAAENYDISLSSSKLRREGTLEVLKNFIDKFNNAE